MTTQKQDKLTLYRQFCDELLQFRYMRCGVCQQTKRLANWPISTAEGHKLHSLFLGLIEHQPINEHIDIEVLVNELKQRDIRKLTFGKCLECHRQHKQSLTAENMRVTCAELLKQHENSYPNSFVSIDSGFGNFFAGHSLLADPEFSPSFFRKPNFYYEYPIFTPAIYMMFLQLPKSHWPILKQAFIERYGFSVSMQGAFREAFNSYIIESIHHLYHDIRKWYCLKKQCSKCHRWLVTTDVDVEKWYTSLQKQNHKQLTAYWFEPSYRSATGWGSQCVECKHGITPKNIFSKSS